MRAYLEFEKPLEELELKVEELRQLRASPDGDGELEAARQRLMLMRKEIFSALTPWQRCQLARHPDRPYTMDYINKIADGFVEFHGDRRYADDTAILGGFCQIDSMSALIVGHQKGRGTKERIQRNFGQPHPEGYRKAIRLIKLAERFKIPVITFIDTPGAYPGIGAEERGQSEAIAENLMQLSTLTVPIISIVIGEGGSGGALALGVADRIFMMEHSVYSVISPEGCAAILWKSDSPLTQSDFARAATALKLTAYDLLEFSIIDGIIEEPQGGAHSNHDDSAKRVKRCIVDTMKTLRTIPADTLVKERYSKYRNLGIFKNIL